jgi:hypothetical protein
LELFYVEYISTSATIGTAKLKTLKRGQWINRWDVPTARQFLWIFEGRIYLTNFEAKINCYLTTSCHLAETEFDEEMLHTMNWNQLEKGSGIFLEGLRKVSKD